MSKRLFLRYVKITLSSNFKVHKQSFTGTQVHSFVYILFIWLLSCYNKVAAFTERLPTTTQDYKDTHQNT